MYPHMKLVLHRPNSSNISLAVYFMYFFLCVLTIYTAAFYCSIGGNRANGTNRKDENRVGDHKLHKGSEESCIAHDEAWNREETIR